MQIKIICPLSLDNGLHIEAGETFNVKTSIVNKMQFFIVFNYNGNDIIIQHNNENIKICWDDTFMETEIFKLKAIRKKENHQRTYNNIVAETSHIFISNTGQTFSKTQYEDDYTIANLNIIDMLDDDFISEYVSNTNTGTISDSEAVEFLKEKLGNKNFDDIDSILEAIYVQRRLEKYISNSTYGTFGSNGLGNVNMLDYSKLYKTYNEADLDYASLYTEVLINRKIPINKFYEHILKNKTFIINMYLINKI